MLLVMGNELGLFCNLLRDYSTLPATVIIDTIPLSQTLHYLEITANYFATSRLGTVHPFTQNVHSQVIIIEPQITKYMQTYPE